MEIREVLKTEYRETENLIREAFWNVYCPGCSEHLVLHKLRNSSAFVPELDYVAVCDGKLVGSIVYTKMFQADTKERCEKILVFGPVGVLPEYQKRGIGEALIQETLKKAAAMGFQGVLITGDSKYYKRFGFEPASRYGVFLPGMSKAEEHPFFMAKELETGAFKNCGGDYTFADSFEVSPQELETFEQGFPKKKKREARESDLG